ncbi:MAG: hypothetical protein H7240_07305 [Glaciimonas sp.]|nr:hypothetical protein [Glaciimonas sp.]
MIITGLRSPFDNNQAECDIYMPNLKQKIQAVSVPLRLRCILHDSLIYLATLRKQERPVFQALAQVLSGNVRVLCFGAE